MGIFSKIGAKIAQGVIGTSADSAGKLIAQADTIVQRYAPGITGKDDMIKELIALQGQGQDSARAHDQPMASGIPFADALINGLNRLIRPGVTLGLIGGYLGWWHLPAPDTVDPELYSMLKIVLSFYFGGRAVFKDLPQAIGYLKGLR